MTLRIPKIETETRVNLKITSNKSLNKLNPKKAIVVVDGSSWNVPYSMLFPVLSGETCDQVTSLPPESAHAGEQ
ncbi:hypothetical protein HC723_13370 [Vibrio sp. S11_S32]|uniref:hypothetical protein n=1 Tax=Vibrio sp. S11_S32 TaxID=2720225 RepID=UPI001681BA66|nr:hypothetical protein [Vibrio sp. S11_S32]MBD1577413.1 hypothetical protein [Vibrio sp. S11_S32]